MQSHAPTIFPTPDRIAALDRLGDEIAELVQFRWRMNLHGEPSFC